MVNMEMGRGKFSNEHNNFEKKIKELYFQQLVLVTNLKKIIAPRTLQCCLVITWT